MTSITLTTSICRLAKSDAKAAFAKAKQLKKAVNQSHALAYVGLYEKNERQSRAALEQSLAAARVAADPFVTIRRSVWPLSAASSRQHHSIMKKHTPLLVGTSKSIQPLSSRSHALRWLLGGIVRGDIAYWRSVLYAMLAAAQPVVYWRQRVDICDAALWVNDVCPQLMPNMYRSISDEKALRRIKKDIAARVQPHYPSLFHL